MRRTSSSFPPGPALDIRGISDTGEAVPIIRMGRGALLIRVTDGAFAADVVTTHLKSKLLSFPRPGGETSFTPRDEEERAQAAGVALMRRSAEAVTVRIRANSLLEGTAQAPLFLLGDFNDVPEAQTSLVLTGPGGSEIGTVGFDRPDQGDDARLFNLAPLIPEARRFSRIYRGPGELIDHIYASEEFFPLGPDSKRRRPQVDSLIDFAGTLSSVTDNPLERVGEIVPDHAPVIASFGL